MKSLIVKSFRRWSRENPPARKRYSQQEALDFYLSLGHSNAKAEDWPEVLVCLLKEGLVQ